MPDTFELFGATHAVVVLVSSALGFWAVRVARRVAGTPAERLYRRWGAAVVLAPNLGAQVLRMLPENWNVDASLPLHLCDFAWMAAGWSLLDRRRLPALLVYYWGIGLSAQAFVTPTLEEGPTTLRFWTFWVLHWTIVTTAAVQVLAFGLRPDLRGLLASLAVSLVLFFSVLGVNLALGTPYFFNSPTDSHVEGTPIALLGPWPLRLLWLILAVVLIFWLLTWPWIRREREPVAGDA